MANVINATSTGNGGLVSTGDDSGILNIQTNEATAITVDASQNVGIGTTSIATIDATGKTLEIYGGAGGGFVHMTNSTTGQTASDGFIIGTSVGGSDALLVQRESANMIFRTADTERMRITSSGIFLVGTNAETPGYGNTNTGAQLSNNGSHFSRAATDWAMTVNQNTADGSARYLIGFRVSNGQVGNIQSNGTNCTYNSNSDYRLKENIAPMTGALAKVALLKPVTYKWKVDGSDGEGFIAHELQAIVPDCVTGEKDAVDADGNPVYQGIDTSFLVATLTAALQETKALIDTQAETINALTARIVALEQA